MTTLPFVPPEDQNRALIKKAAELVRDTGITVKQAIQIVKGFQPELAQKPPKPAHQSPLHDVAPLVVRSDGKSEIELTVQPYLDALDVLRNALEAQRALKGKKMKTDYRGFSTIDTSDGGSFEREAVRAIAKRYDVGKDLDERLDVLRSWIDRSTRFPPDTSPGQIVKVNEAVAHLRIGPEAS